MRRISLALALVGAVAAAGCGGAGNTKPASSDDKRGIETATFKVKVRGESAVWDPAVAATIILPGGGRVTSNKGGIDCGIVGSVLYKTCEASFAYNTNDVQLTATDDTGAGYGFHAFAGACQGMDPCVIGTVDSGKLVMVRFAKTQAGLGSHPNYSNPAIHGPSFEAKAFTCTECHGAALEGAGFIPACASCHNGTKAFAITFPAVPAEVIVKGGHFDPTKEAWKDDGGWSRKCLRCHTNQGFRDYVGVDGTDNHLDGTFQTNNLGPSTTEACTLAGNCAAGLYAYGPLKCETCHNAKTEPTTGALTTLLFPSMAVGQQVTTDASTAVCGQCHQGRESTTSVNTKIGTTAADAVIGAPTGISFVNPHYLGAAGTLFGADAKMWAQYDGKTYATKFLHGGLNSCTYCHDAHGGEVLIAKCGQCHTKADGSAVVTLTDLESSRQIGWTGDIDGDGNATETIKDEIDGLAGTLYTAIKAYAKDVVGTSVIYNGAAHPYFYVDTNGDGVQQGYDANGAMIDPANAESTAFKAFTPRLLRAAFNYKWTQAEKGAWAHNARYAVQVLYDAIEDLNAGLTNKVTFNGTVRDTFAPAAIALLGGHFAAEGENSGACARCHTGSGFRDYIGADGSADNHVAGYTGTGSALQNAGALNNTTFTERIQCNACHNGVTFLGGGSLNTVRFPQYSGAGKTVTVDTTQAICGQCHTGARDGRNVATVGSKIAAAAPATVDTVLASGNSAVRPHYLSAASTLLGGDAAAYAQMTGAIYTGRNAHGGLAACTACHNAHSGQLPDDGTNSDQIGGKCGACHFDELTGQPVSTFVQLEETRQFGFEGDIDGNGTQDTLKLEIEGLKAKLLGALRAYGANVGGADMCIALGDSGLAERAYVNAAPNMPCGTAPNATEYNKFTTRSLRAAFNYMAIQNDPGAWAHNPRYAIEILYDSIADLNAGLVAKAFNTKVVANGLRSFDGHFGGASKGYSTMIYHGGSNAVTGETLPTMGFTSGACYQCHGGTAGFAEYLKAPTAPAWPATNEVPAGCSGAACTSPATSAPFVAYQTDNIQCATCHAFDGADLKGLRTDVTSLNLPPAKTTGFVTVTNMAPSIAVCGTCHSGREGMASVVAKAAVKGTFNVTLPGPHYLGAAGVLFGSDGHMLYEYTGMSYTGKPVFWATGTNGAGPGPYGSAHGAECTGCHQPKASKHTFEVDFAYCATCHVDETATGGGDYRLAPIEEEFRAAQAELYAAIRAYVTANLDAVKTATSQPNLTNICWDDAGASGSYWFQEINGTCTVGSATAFKKFDAPLLKAAYNYLWTKKEPGAWAHNEFYVMQVMYDGIVDLAGTPTFTVTADEYNPASTLNRPVVP